MAAGDEPASVTYKWRETTATLQQNPLPYTKSFTHTHLVMEVERCRPVTPVENRLPRSRAVEDQYRGTTEDGNIFVERHN